MNHPTSNPSRARLRFTGPLFVTLACFLLWPGAVRAVDRISATLTFLGGTTNAQTITVNGSTRTYVNTVATPSTQILTNHLAGSAATNTAQHFAATPVAQVTLYQSATNVLSWAAADGVALVITMSPTNYGAVVYTTQTVANLYTVRVPMSAEPATRRLTNANDLVTGIQSYATTIWAASTVALSNMVNLSSAQHVTGAKTFTGATVISNTGAMFYNGTVSNALAISGNFYRVTNGVWWSGFLSAPTLTNGVNYGNAFSSKGSGTSSEAFGVGATATEFIAQAFGRSSIASGTNSLAVGYAAEATVLSSVALGNIAIASGNYSTAVGWDANATALASSAFGADSSADHLYSTAIGSGAVTTDSNQVRIGTATVSASVLNDLHIGDNLFIGNDWSSPLNSLAKGILFTNGTAAAANPTNGAALWVASGELQYRTSAASEGADATMRLHNRASQIVGSGADFAHAGTAYARVDFGGTDPEIALPTAGTYLVTAIVAVTTTTAGDALSCKFYNSTDAADVASSERTITSINANTTAQMTCQNVVTVTAGKTIQLFAKNATAARGGVTAVTTTVSYVRLY